jgi:transposase
MVLRIVAQKVSLLQRLDELLAQHQAGRARIAELEAKLGTPPKTPDNSSLPPSHGQKANVAATPKQRSKGHPGVARVLAESPDVTRILFAERCPCGKRVGQSGQQIARAYDHVDLPPIKPVMTRINLFRTDCPCCRKPVTATAPTDMPEGTLFGPGIAATVAYLHGCQLMS